MKAALKAIAQQTGMHLSLTEVSSKKLTKSRLVKWIQQIKPTKNDMIYFHFSGHGKRDTYKRSRWPEMFFTPKNELVPFQAVINAIQAKNVRFSIMICDSCNTNSIPRKTTPLMIVIPKDSQAYEQKEAMKKLFLKTKGSIIASGAIPGTVAWNSDKGGIFSNSFMASLQKELRKSDPQWKSLLESTLYYATMHQKPQIVFSITEM